MLIKKNMHNIYMKIIIGNANLNVKINNLH